MRKYLIPKTLYVLTILLLSCVSFCYTYAYFSAMDIATGNITLGSVSLQWYDATTASSISYWYDDPNTTIDESQSIALTSTLARGQFVELKAKDRMDTNDNANDDRKISLQIYNGGTSDSYCRIKVTATYLTEGAAANAIPEVCNGDWLELSYGKTEQGLITKRGWFYDEATSCYYYGSKTTMAGQTTYSLTSVKGGTGVFVADYIYLSPESNAEILNSRLKIVLTLEGVQTSHNAYQQVWGLK